jgi:hypothetical protein
MMTARNSDRTGRDKTSHVLEVHEAHVYVCMSV